MLNRKYFRGSVTLKFKVNKITVMLERVLMTFKKPSFIFPPFKCISFNSKTSREIPM